MTLACEDYSGELTTIRQQLTEAKAEVDSLRLTLIETQAELQRHNAIMVDNGVRAEKAESDLVSFLQTLEVRAEDNRFLRQENKRLLAEVEKFKNQYSGGL